MKTIKTFVKITVLALSLLLLSSCGLFECKHKEYSEKVVEPNCFAEGYTEHTCTKCEESYKDNITPKTHHYFAGEACPNCGMEEITENITPDTEWYNAETAVFEITTKEQLAGLASLVNSGTDFSDVKIYLDADIDLGYYEWIPIGNAENAFNGTFDGDGHTVSGLKINANYDYVGFFGKVSGKISNFSIVEANIYVKRDHNYVSIACGYSTGDIKEISTDGFIEAPKSNSVGAIAGAVAPASIEYSNLTNKASINAQNYVGGIIGHVNASGILQTNYISNTGSVKGVTQVGGAVGYVKGASSSIVSGVSVSADIVADYCIGGVVGKAENVIISTCTNDGSTITANSYYTSGSNFYVWLGGFVGDGYGVDNCVNNIDITYNAKGSYVGGIIGFARNNINNCTNNGDITTNTNCVGGVAGEINSSAERNISNLTNTGNIAGNSKVGGVVGCLYQVSDQCGSWYAETNKQTCYYGSYGNHLHCFTTTLSNALNSGNVTSEESYGGGIVGYVELKSTYKETYRYCCTSSYYEHGGHSCTFYGDFRLNSNNLGNTGNVVGKNVGEIFGQFSSDAPSTIVTYTVIGKVTVNGEVKEGTYDVGANTNLTLSGREIYTEEENTETVE